MSLLSKNVNPGGKGVKAPEIEMTEPKLIIEREDGYAVLTINRPRATAQQRGKDQKSA